MFSFYSTGFHTKVKEPSLTYYFANTRDNSWIYTFPKDIRNIWNAESFVQDLNSGNRVHILRR